MNVKFMNPSLSSWMEGAGNQAEGFRSIIRRTGGFPGGLVVKNPSADAGDVKRLGFGPWVIKIPWRRKWQPTPLFLPEVIPWTEEPGGL